MERTGSDHQPKSWAVRLIDAGGRYGLHAAVLRRACPGWSALALALTVTSAAIGTATLITTGRFIGALPDAISQGADSGAAGSAWLWFGWTAAMFVAGPIVESLGGWVTANVSRRYLAYVLDLIAETGASPHGIGHLDSPAFAGRLHALVRAAKDWTFVQGVDSTWTIVSVRLTGVGAAAVLISWRWWVPFVVAASYVLLSRAFKRWVDTAFDELLATTGNDRRRATYVRSLMTGTAAAKEVRLFGLTDWLASRYRDLWTSAMRIVWRHRSHSLAPILATCAVQVITVGGAFVLLSYDAIHGDVGLGSVVMLAQAILALQAFGIIGDATTWLARNTTAARQLTLLRQEVGLRRLDADPAPESAARPRHGAATVTFDDLDFTYPTRESPTIHGLHLHVPAGQSIAIVGVNGAGKSTLIKLLCGLYAPTSGTVRVDGADPFTDEPARRRVAVIFQDFVRYHLPLRDNVGVGAVDHLHDDVILARALTDAGGDDVLARLDNGWDTVLSAEYDGGTDLSGGQWQRVALARALAAVSGGAGVLVLDEPTAALDVRAEAALFDRFLEVTRGVTTILVSHRLSSVRHADRIVVLDDGIVEDGTHDELLAAGGRYAEMFMLQARRFANAAGEAN